jgi:hypothetical protein
VNVQIDPKEVLIVQGDTKLVVPRDIYDGAEEAGKSSEFRKGVSQVLRAVDADPAIESLGFSSNSGQAQPLLQIPRERFNVLPALLDDKGTLERDVLEVTDVQILRAILERSKRKWEFSWNGIKISAPVSDSHFYNDFFAHKITIAPGDALRVRLRIRQRRNPDTGVFINQEYEVLEVFQHLSGSQHQTRLGLRQPW